MNLCWFFVFLVVTCFFEVCRFCWLAFLNDFFIVFCWLLVSFLLLWLVRGVIVLVAGLVCVDVGYSVCIFFS